jgi:hypothetical protein
VEGYPDVLQTPGAVIAEFRVEMVCANMSPEVIGMSTSTLAREPQHDKPSVKERIRQRAHELYIQRGSPSGSGLDDWLRAEDETLQAQDAAVDEAAEESGESFPASARRPIRRRRGTISFGACQGSV